MLLRGPLSWADRLPRFCVAPFVGVTDSLALAWPLGWDLGLATSDFPLH